MWLLLPFLVCSSLLADTTRAVNAQAFFFPNCDSFRDNGQCTNLQEDKCCHFHPTTGLFEELKKQTDDGSTQSVLWTGLRRCLSLVWFYPNPRHPGGAGSDLYNCGGDVRASENTGEDPPRELCSSHPGRGGKNDGAKWYDILQAALRSGAKEKASLNCGKTHEYSGDEIGKEVEDLANSLHLSSSSRSSFGQKLFGSMSGSWKRDRQMRRENKVAIQNALSAARKRKCVGGVFATHYGWTPGTGVWVLDGSEESHARMSNVTQDNTPMTWNMHLKLAGAKYYDHWAEHPATAYSMLNKGYTFTHDDIAWAKAKRSDKEDPPTEDDFAWPQNDSESQSSMVYIERSADEAVADSFSGLPEQLNDDDNEGLTRRDINAPVADSFSGLPEQLDDDEEQSV